VKWSAEEVADVPAGVVTWTSTAPDAVAAGTVAVMDPSELNVNNAATPPNVTPVTPVKALPPIVSVRRKKGDFSFIPLI